MAYEPTIWKDRVVEKPRTFNIVNNPDGTVTLVPAPGVVVEEGTPVNAANLNKLEQGLKTHEAESATQEELGHIKLSDMTKGFGKITALPTIDNWVCPGWSIPVVKDILFPQDRIFYVPIYIAQETSFSETAIYVGPTPVASTSVELAIYKFNANNMPGELVINLGTLDTSTTGVKSIIAPLTLSEGYYYCAVRTIGGAPQLRGTDITRPSIFPVSGVSSRVDSVAIDAIPTLTSGATELTSVVQQPDSMSRYDYNPVRFKVAQGGV